MTTIGSPPAKPALNTADRVLAARASLERAREHTLAIIEPLTPADVATQHDPLMSPILWDLGHIAAFEALWLLENAAPRWRSSLACWATTRRRGRRSTSPAPPMPTCCAAPADGASATRRWPRAPATCSPLPPAVARAWARRSCRRSSSARSVQCPCAEHATPAAWRGTRSPCRLRVSLHLATRVNPMTAAPDPTDLFAGDGEMRAAFRRHDWSATPLGAEATWSPALHSITGRSNRHSTWPPPRLPHLSPVGRLACRRAGMTAALLRKRQSPAQR